MSTDETTFAAAPWVDLFIPVDYEEYVPDPETRQGQLVAPWTVYVLTDQNGEVRYVGCTRNAMDKRMASHIAKARARTPPSGQLDLYLWLRGELLARRKVAIREVHLAPDGPSALRKEADLIAGMLLAGAIIFNRQPQVCAACGSPCHPGRNCSSRREIWVVPAGPARLASIGENST